jgi:SAM-dependent methyltransferase
LDIACGEGYGSNLLASAALEVTGVDIDGPSIARAEKKYRLDNLAFRQGSADRIPLGDAAVDLVVSFETLEHVSFHEQMLNEIRRVLRPGGVLLMSTPDKRVYSDLRNYRNPFHVRELYAAEFESLIRGHFAHAVFLKQQYLTGSLIFDPEGPGMLSAFNGGYASVTADRRPDGMYLVTIASDDAEAAVSPGHSFFAGESLVEAAVAQAVRRVQASRSYRLGQALLAPLQILRRK